VAAGEAVPVAYARDLAFTPDTPVLVVFGGAEGIIIMVDHAAVASITDARMGDVASDGGPAPTR
jgi:hypothetical protein